MPTVNGVVSTTVGVVGGTVTAQLVGTVAGQTVPVVGFFTTGTREIVTRVATTAADGTGAWSLVLPSNLDPNLSPANTYYQITEIAAGSQSSYYVQVPNGAGPYWVGNILVQPTTVSPPIIGAQDSLVVHLAGTETFTGAKTFNVAPAVPSNAFPESAITGLLADLAARAAIPVVADAVQFVSGAGNDSNNGLSWGTAKATIAAAVTALPSSGGVVWCGAGTFASPSISKANTFVRGVGPQTVIISPSSGGGPGLAFSAAFCRLEDVAVKPQGTYFGDLLTLTTAPDFVCQRVVFDGTAATSAYGYSINVVSGDRPRVIDCDFLLNNGATAYGWTAVFVQAGLDSFIEDCRIQGGRNYGIDIRSTTGLSIGARILNNRIDSPAAHGIIVWNGYATVMGNRVKTPSGSGIFMTGDPSAGQTHNGSRVIGNTLESSLIGIDVEYDVHNLKIIGNEVYSPSGNGISMIRQITDVAIVGNTVISSGGSYGGIACQSYNTTNTSSRIAVVGNTVRSSTNKGIFLEDGDSSIIEGNIVSNCAVGIAVNPNYAANVVNGVNRLTGNTADYQSFPGVCSLSQGVQNRVKAGTPVDGDFAAAPPDGTIVADSTGNKIWVRLGGVWKGATVT